MSKVPREILHQEPLAGLPRLLFKLRHEGPQWIWRRFRSEFVLPTTKPGKMVHAVMRRGLANLLAPGRALRRAMGEVVPVSSDTLYAFYDLKVEPITYDIVWFLSGADLERRRRDLEYVHPVIVPGPAGGLREEDALYECVVDREARRWRIHHVLIGALGLLPSCVGFTLAGSREEAAAIHVGAKGRIYPRTYEPTLPVAHHPNDSLLPLQAGTNTIGVLRASQQGLRYVDRWLSLHVGNRRLVTVTLRDYKYNPDRNSNVAAWAEFAGHLDHKLWMPVFVLDTERSVEHVPEPIGRFAVLREASWNMALRMALYERAWLNLGVNNGPMGLCWLNEKTRYITFKMVTPSARPASLALNKSRGFEPGRSLPFATPFQKWVWEEDTVGVIRREFQAMTGLIESADLGSLV